MKKVKENEGGSSVSIIEELKKVKRNIPRGHRAIIRNGEIVVIEPFSGNAPRENHLNGYKKIVV